MDASTCRNQAAAESATLIPSSFITLEKNLIQQNFNEWNPRWNHENIFETGSSS